MYISLIPGFGETIYLFDIQIHSFYDYGWFLYKIREEEKNIYIPDRV